MSCHLNGRCCAVMGCLVEGHIRSKDNKENDMCRVGSSCPIITLVQMWTVDTSTNFLTSFRTDSSPCHFSSHQPQRTSLTSEKCGRSSATLCLAFQTCFRQLFSSRPVCLVKLLPSNKIFQQTGFQLPPLITRTPAAPERPS